MTVFSESVVFTGSVTRTSDWPGLSRSELIQSDNEVFVMELEGWKTWDALHTNLPGTAASDDLALITGTFGTSSPTIQAGDLKAAGSTTRRAGRTYSLPSCYVAGQSVTIRAHCGMNTTIADNSCTIDFEAYRCDGEGGIGSDLVTTSATSFNSTTDADKDFVLTATTLGPGDTLVIRMTVVCNDAATVTAVTPQIGKTSFLLDVKG